MRRIVLIIILGAVLALGLTGFASAAPKGVDLTQGTFEIVVKDGATGKVLPADTNKGGIQPLSGGSSGWDHPSHTWDSTYQCERSTCQYYVYYKTVAGSLLWHYCVSVTWYWENLPSPFGHINYGSDGPTRSSASAKIYNLGLGWHYDGTIGEDSVQAQTYYYHWRQASFSFPWPGYPTITKLPQCWFTCDYTGGINFAWNL